MLLQRVIRDALLQKTPVIPLPFLMNCVLLNNTRRDRFHVALMWRRIVQRRAVLYQCPPLAVSQTQPMRLANPVLKYASFDPPSRKRQIPR